MEKAIHLRLPESLYENIEKLCKLEGFASLQEFIRDSLRDSVKKRQLKKDIAWLRSQMGTLKHRPSEEDLRLTEEEYLKKDLSELFRKYGLDKARKI